MQVITPRWPEVLTDHVNRLYDKQFLASELTFTHNVHYPLREHVKVIDVKGTDLYLNESVFQIVPFDASDYFSGVPLIIHTDIALTGEKIVQALRESYGVDFDDDVDLTQDFLIGSYDPGTDVVIKFNPTSFIWEGEVTVRLRETSNDLNHVVKVRNLEALIIPDIIEPDTQSLQLILWPTIIKNQDVRRAFSTTRPVLLGGELLDKLMIDIYESGVVEPAYQHELFTLLAGQTLITDNELDADGKLIRKTELAIRSDSFSGVPMFHVEPLLEKHDLRQLVGDIDMSNYSAPNVDWTPYTQPLNGTTFNQVTKLLDMQTKWEPTKAEGISQVQEAIRAQGEDKVFSSYSRNVTARDYDQGKVTITIGAHPDSEFTGVIRLIYPLERFVVEMEKGGFFQTEQGGDVDLEVKRYVLTDKQKPLASNNHLNNSPLGRVTSINLSFLDLAFELRDTVSQNETDEGTEYKSSVDTTPTILEPK